MTMPSLFDPQPQSSFTPERFQEFCEAADALNRQDRELQAHIDAFMARLQVTDAHRAEAEQTSVYRSGVAPFGGPAYQSEHKAFIPTGHVRYYCGDRTHPYAQTVTVMAWTPSEGGSQPQEWVIRLYEYDNMFIRPRISVPTLAHAVSFIRQLDDFTRGLTCRVPVR